MTEGFRTPRSRRAAYTFVWVLTILFILGVVDVGVSTYRTTRSIKEQQAATERIAHAILDCTTPGGECYSDGQKRTAQAVIDIAKVSAYANACADAPGEQTDAEVLACVMNRLANDPDRAD